MFFLASPKVPPYGQTDFPNPSTDNMVRTVFQNIFTPTAFKAGLLSILFCCLAWFSFGYKKPHFLEGIDARIVDTMFRVRGAQDSSGSVVIVNIDEKSLKEYGQWPWPRDIVAKLTDSIFASKPLVLGFDIMFAERDRTSPDILFEKYKRYIDFKDNDGLHPLSSFNNPELNHDFKLAKAIGNGKSVQGYMFLFREDFLKSVTDPSPFPSLDISIDSPGVEFRQLKLINAYRPILNIPEVSSGVTEGFLNVFPDQGGIIRKIPLFILMDNLPYPSLALEMYRVASDLNGAQIHISTINNGPYRPLLGVSLGNSLFRTDDAGQMSINFRGPFHTFLYVSASDVLKGSEDDILKNKYVLIGSSAAGIMDLVATPFSSRMPGVEVHANVLDNLINNDPMVWENYTEIGITYSAIIAGGLILTTALVYFNPISGLLVSLLVFMSIALGNYYLLFLNNQLLGPSFILISLIIVFTTVTFCNYLFEGRRRIFIRKAFSHYVAPSIVNELLKNPEKLGLQVDTREVTILFCDIRRFTNLAEHASPGEVSHFLNNYFSLMTEIIIKNNGMVDKYIGDAVMAVWGSPLHNPQHAMDGVKAACEMVAAIEKNSDKLKLAGESIQIGIGLNSGVVSAGNFGCDKHFDYTVLGDSVNLASRVEQLTRQYPVDILITENTKNMIEAEIECRYIDRVQVKGRNNSVELFEPLGLIVNNEHRKEEFQLYQLAITSYQTGDFEQAQKNFTTLFQNTGDTLYQLYTKRCLRSLQQPPPSDREGTLDQPHTQ